MLDLQPIGMLGLLIMSPPSTMSNTILGFFRGSKRFLNSEGTICFSLSPTTPFARHQDELPLTHEQMVQKVRVAPASVAPESAPSPIFMEDDMPLQSLFKRKDREPLNDTLGPHGIAITKSKN